MAGRLRGNGCPSPELLRFVFPLDSRQATINQQVDAGDVVALIRGEEQSCSRDLFGKSLSAQWDHRSDLFFGFGSALFGRELPVEHRRFDRTWTQHVGPDLSILEFAGPRAG